MRACETPTHVRGRTPSTPSLHATEASAQAGARHHATVLARNQAPPPDAPTHLPDATHPPHVHAPRGTRPRLRL
ncbi:hypothetical protein BVI2075_470011 [Burkholderia vietnamiensis]|nr:hypothetical protein BVI2075_470011 [Burkholderia vietnamiensis]